MNLSHKPVKNVLVFYKEILEV